MALLAKSASDSSHPCYAFSERLCPGGAENIQRQEATCTCRSQRQHHAKENPYWTTAAIQFYFWYDLAILCKKLPLLTIAVVGAQEKESRTVNIRNRDDQATQAKGDLVPLQEALEKLVALRKERRLSNAI